MSKTVLAVKGRVTIGRKNLERALDENERAFGLFIYSKLKGYINGTKRS
jgi:hypothetical protein